MTIPRRVEAELRHLHEAGHAVVAHALGARIQNVTQNELLLATVHALEGEEFATMALAGAVSARLFGPPWRSAMRGHSDTDLRAAAEALGTDSLDSWTTSQLERRAQSLLLDRESSVRAVASALGRTHSLTGPEIASLCDGLALTL